MVLYEWKSFGTDTDYYTKDVFEKEVNDVFECMMIDEARKIPNYIWTKNFVVIIKSASRLYEDVAFVKIPRNPSVA